MGLFSGEGCIVRGLEEEDASGRDPYPGECGGGICVLYEGSRVDGGGDIDEWGWEFCLNCWIDNQRWQAALGIFICLLIHDLHIS